MLNMGGSQKSKRVSWASDVNLCQVKLFLSEDSPSQVGHGNQDHLQPKITRPGGFVGNRPDGNLPPGFEVSQPVNHWNSKLSQIPMIKWKCPPRFKVNTAWQVVSGEESKEIEAETLRQAKVLEAIYPRIIAIPPNPSEPSVVENINDQNTLVVPLMPVEEEDPPPLDTSLLGPSQPQTHLANSYQGNSSSTNPRANSAPSPLSALDPNVLSNLQAALSSYTSAGPNQGTLIDQDLLIRILSNSNIVEELVKKQAMASSSLSSSTVHSRPPLSMPTPPHQTPSWVPSNANLQFNPQSSWAPPVPEVSAPPASKDMSYYKSLIHQHGGERRENATPYSHHGQHTPFGTTNQGKPRINKPCMYFNTPRGCRNGANCAFFHDMSSQAQQRIGGGGRSEVPSAKRVKMDREITGT